MTTCIQCNVYGRDCDGDGVNQCRRCTRRRRTCQYRVLINAGSSDVPGGPDPGSKGLQNHDASGNIEPEPRNVQSQHMLQPLYGNIYEPQPQGIFYPYQNMQASDVASQTLQSDSATPWPLLRREFAFNYGRDPPNSLTNYLIENENDLKRYEYWLRGLTNDRKSVLRTLLGPFALITSHSAIEWARTWYESFKWDRPADPLAPYHYALALGIFGNLYEFGVYYMNTDIYYDRCVSVSGEVTRGGEERNDMEVCGVYTHQTENDFSDLVKNGVAAVNRRDAQN